MGGASKALAFGARERTGSAYAMARVEETGRSQGEPPQPEGDRLPERNAG